LRPDSEGRGAAWGKNGSFARQKPQFFIVASGVALTTCEKTSKIIEKFQKNLLSNHGVLPIVRPNAPFWCGWVNCLLPHKNRIRTNQQQHAGGTD
jgi:hypothetical protein